MVGRHCPEPPFSGPEGGGRIWCRARPLARLGPSSQAVGRHTLCGPQVAHLARAKLPGLGGEGTGSGFRTGAVLRPGVLPRSPSSLPEADLSSRPGHVESVFLMIVVRESSENPLPGRSESRGDGAGRGFTSGRSRVSQTRFPSFLGVRPGVFSTGVWTASPGRIGLWSGTLTPLRGPAVSPRLTQGFLSPPTPSPRSAAVPICGAVVCCRVLP